MAKKSLTRRDFIKLAGATLGTSVLAACTPQVVTQLVNQTQIVNQTSIVKQTQLEVVTATSAPTNTPEPAKLEVWWNTNLPDLTTADWHNDPNDPVFKAEWYWGGLGRLKYRPFLTNHPGVTMNITTHSWDTDLRTNQLLAIASGQQIDTTYGEGFVNEFVQYGVYIDLDPAKAALFPPGPMYYGQSGGKYYALPKSTGGDTLFVNLDVLAATGVDATKLPTTWDELVTFCKAISAKNNHAKWGNTAYYTYASGNSYGNAMRVLQWFNMNNCPLTDPTFNPTANTAGAADTWFFHNELMWTSTYDLLTQAESEGGSGELFNEGIIAVKPGWNNDATSVGNGFQADGKTPVQATAIAFPAPTAGGKTSSTVIGNDMESAFKNSKWLDVAKAVVEETTTDEASQAFLADNAGIWIPALKSQLDQFATYDKLGGYKSDVAKKMVRVTMQVADDPGTVGIPGFKKNASDIWTEWNNCYYRILTNKAPGLSKDDIQKQLDALQTYIQGRLA